jgi:hypothetical protein
LVLAWWASCPTSARAATDDCVEPGKRWIAVRLQGPGWTPELAESVLTDIRAEVRHHGIEICGADHQGPLPPIVTLTIEASEPSVMRMSLDLTDPVSGRPPARDLQLDSMPADGHSLAVAVAADELLTSSWIKLASRPVPAVTPPPPPPQPAKAPPPALAVIVAEPAPHEAAPRRYELGLLGATERLGDGAWSSGLDLSLRRWLRPRWAVELGAGARAQIDETAPHGLVRSRAWPVSLRLIASAVPFSGHVRAGAAGGVTATPLFVSAVPTAGATAMSETALALYLRGELWADMGSHRLRLRASAGAGIPLRGVTVDDTGVAVGGARGVALYGQLGLVLEL